MIVHCKKGSTMIYSAFGVGVFTSLVVSVWSFERLRDRRLLCDKKFDEQEVLSYLYKMVTLFCHNIYWCNLSYQCEFV